MEGLNKKLSETVERKLDQLESASLIYLLSICFVGASISSILGGSAVLDSTVAIMIFWAGLDIKKDSRKYLWPLFILLSGLIINEKALIISLLGSSAVLLSEKMFSPYRDYYLSRLLGYGILVNLGDIYTTNTGIRNGLSEQNPLLNFFSEYLEISSGLLVSKGLLFIVIIYLYRESPDRIEALLKLFFISGFYIIVSNLNVILSGM